MKGWLCEPRSVFHHSMRRACGKSSVRCFFAKAKILSACSGSTIVVRCARGTERCATGLARASVSPPISDRRCDCSISLLRSAALALSQDLQTSTAVKEHATRLLVVHLCFPLLASALWLTLRCSSACPLCLVHGGELGHYCEQRLSLARLTRAALLTPLATSLASYSDVQRC